jgi:hypothetical protein
MPSEGAARLRGSVVRWYAAEGLMTMRWRTQAAERMRIVWAWPSRCNELREREVLAMVKRLTCGEAIWITRSRIMKSLLQTGHAIAWGRHPFRQGGER